MNKGLIMLLMITNAAAASALEPGKWEITTETFKGYPLALEKSSTSTRCLKADYLQRLGQQFIATARNMGDCDVAEQTIDSDYVRVSFECSSDKMDVSSVYQFEATEHSLTGSIKAEGVYKGERGQEISEVSGVHIGPCR